MTVSSLATAIVLISLGQPGTAPATTVAIVNVPAVSERYKKTGDLETKFEQRRVKFVQQREELQEKVERTKRSLNEEFKPGTAEFDGRRKQLALSSTELEWFVETEGRKIEQELARSLRTIFDDIHAVIRKVAEQRDIDVVLAADQLPPEPPTNTTQVRQQIILQKVLYWNPRVDLTDAVVERLNAEYAASQPSSPSGAVNP